MIERHRRNAELALGAQRRPRAMAGIARLDQVRLQRVQDARRCAPTDTRHAIAVDAGKGDGGNFDQRRRGAAAVDVGADDGVADAAAPGQPARLGVQVGADAAAFRGVEHGDVDEMHA